VRLGRISRLVSPGYGNCEKCKTTWNFVKPRPVMLDGSGGVFALCEKCWQESDTADRIQYHRQVWWMYHAGSMEWEAVRKAVIKASEGQASS
jgi:hypothetical protein